MPSQHLTNTPLDMAKAEYMELLIKNGMAPKSETLPVADAAGRVTAAPVYARINVPHYSASAMDGVALEAKLTIGAAEATPVYLNAGQYKMVDTGDPLPDGCDAVIMSEDITEYADGRIRLIEAATPWQHIRRIGEDICAYEMILPSYSQITPSALGAMIAGGVTEISVIKRPVAGIIPTGSQLIPPASDPGQGEILEFNSAIFSAMLREWGAEAVTYQITGDGCGEISETLKTALSECDIVLMGSGSSSGGGDSSEEAISGIGSILYHGLAIKPGKPAILGYCGPKPILGVPGYPVSGIIVIEQILRPIIEYLSRTAPETYRHADAVLSKAVVSTPEYREFVRARLGYVKGRLIASPLGRGSGIVTSFMKADGIIEVPQGVDGHKSGEVVSVRLLRHEEELKNSIVAIGSHDPMLDEISELLRKKYGNISLASAHVGSMGGLIAVRRGEAHVAGIHLLDEETGGYNTTFIRKYIPKGGVKLVECVKRTQGFILQKGNPLGIAGVADLARDGIRYVNRQKGSGTRILIDYLCREHHIDTLKIHGYDREEYTHTAVAALIAANSADAGLGIYSVAKLYDLDFLPVCDEQYDLLIPDHAWETPMIRKLMDILESGEFRQRLDELGGYTVETPGRVIEFGIRNSEFGIRG